MKKILLLILSFSIVLAMVSGCSSGTPKMTEEEKKTIRSNLYDSIDTIEFDLDFLSRNAGNVNGAGSMKIADTMLNGILESCDAVSEEQVIGAVSQEAGSNWKSIVVNCKQIVEYCKELGSNNTTNLNKMKQMCSILIGTDIKEIKKEMSIN